MKLSILDTQSTPITVLATPAADAAGNAGVFAGPLSYTVSDAAIVKITPSADTLSVNVEHVGPLGSGVTVTATDGVVSQSFTVDVVSSEAKDILFAVAPAAVPAAAPAAPAPAASTAAPAAAPAAAATATA